MSAAPAKADTPRGRLEARHFLVIQILAILTAAAVGGISLPPL